MSELTNQITEKQIELDEVKGTLAKEKREHKKLLNEIDSMKEMNKDIERFTATYTMFNMDIIQSIDPLYM